MVIQKEAGQQQDQDTLIEQSRCLIHPWDKPDGKQLEKQVDVALLLKTRCCVTYVGVN